MRATEETGIGKTRIELKYCECCGGLWLRRAGAQEVCCPACVEAWAGLPASWTNRIKRIEASSGNRDGVIAGYAASGVWRIQQGGLQ